MSARSRSPRSGRAHGSPRSKSGRSSMSAAPTSETHEHLLRPLAPEVLALLVRRYGPFDSCEDAVQEALLAAVRQWPEKGVPENPRAWLLTAASRRLIDEFRSDAARRRREQWDALRTTRQDAPGHDDSLGCCSCAATRRCL